MRILLDECAPRKLGGFITGHDVVTVPDAGWAGVGNGELLRSAAASFDAFLTVDRNLVFQQNQSALPLPVIVLKSASTKLGDLALLVPNLQALLQTSSLDNAVYIVEG